MTTQSEIQEILKFDPQAKQAVTDEEIQQILKFDPVGGTFGPRETPPEGAPTPAPPFPPYPGSHRGYVEPTEEAPSFATMMDASTVDDPITKVGIYAKARGIAVKDIPARYRFSKEGEIEFKTDKGSWQREVGESPGQQLKQMGAGVAAHPSTYLGAAGALAAGPAGAVGGAVAGEIARKTYGRVAHDEPQTFFGNVTSAAFEGLLALGGEMVGKTFAGAWNRVRTRQAPRILARAGSEIHGGLLTAADHARAEYLKALGEKHGIRLLPHQLYDKSSMSDMWMYLRKHPLTADAVQKFDQTLESETKEAMENFIREMGGSRESPYKLGKRTKSAVNEATKDAEKIRQDISGPYYKTAFDDTPIIDKNALKQERAFYQDKIATMQARTEPDVKAMVRGINEAQPGLPTMKIKGESDATYQARITKDFKRVTGKEIPTTRVEGDATTVKAFKDRVEQVEKVLSGEAPAEGMRLPTIPRTVDISEVVKEVNSLINKRRPGDPAFTALARIKKMLESSGGDAETLHNIKMTGIDSVLEKTETKRFIKREMMLVKNKLKAAMDTQVPGYTTANRKYAAASDPVNRLKDSVISAMTDVEKNKDIARIPKNLLNPESMTDEAFVKEARNIIEAYDPGLWKKLVGGYIGGIYDKMTMAQSGTLINNAGKMNQALFGNKTRVRIMAAALGGEKTAEFQTLKGLMEVLQRAAGGKQSQSMTQPFTAIERRMAGGAEETRRFFKNPYDYAVDRAFQYWNDVLLHGNQEKLLTVLTDPAIQAKIAAIKPLAPRSRRYIEGFTTLTALVSTKIDTDRLQGQEEAQTQAP